jgi:hypothetical protein
MAMTAGLLRIERDLAESVRRSLPIRRGDFTAAHIEKCALYYSKLSILVTLIETAGSYLVIGHSSIADLQHIQIIPTPWLSSINIRRQFVQNIDDRAVTSWSYAKRI